MSQQRKPTLVMDKGKAVYLDSNVPVTIVFEQWWAHIGCHDVSSEVMDFLLEHWKEFKSGKGVIIQ